MNYDKVNGDVAFREDGHKYFNLKDDTIKYTSVTTLIEKFGQNFDSNFVSKYKALEKLLPANEWKKVKGELWKSRKIPQDLLEAYDISEVELNKVQQDILDEWSKINKESCERGTKIHAQLENSFYKAGNNVNLSKFGIGGKFVCKKDYSDLDLDYGVYPEYLIYYDNPKLGIHIAGQIDLLVKNGNEINIIDWKSNKEIKSKSFYNQSTRSTTKMKYPLTNLDDCNLNHYYLQLSTYAWMLQKLNPDFTIKTLKIVHFDHDDKQTIYDVPYLKEEVERMLKYHVKQIKLQKQKAKYAHVEY